MRKIYLPELISINLKNYTLYPNGLDFKYDFVKGVNLIVGGNGMGKTTFVNLIKYSIIGNYKKPYEYTRTYKENKIEKRLRNQDSFYSNRSDKSIVLNADSEIIIKFKINSKVFEVTRTLNIIMIKKVIIDGVKIDGLEIEESKYDKLEKDEKERYLQYKYENIIEKESKITFDDLIFFINYILFFGEDHKTILWDEIVQIDLFNKFFNSPELDIKRQDAIRQSKYYDSLSRHKSEDVRAIKKVLEKIEKEQNKDITVKDIIDLKSELDGVNIAISQIHSKREKNEIRISIIQDDINKISIKLNNLENRKNVIQGLINSSKYKSLHKLYKPFLSNIQINHICPICNSDSELLYEKSLNHPDSCWSCGTDLLLIENLDDETKGEYEDINSLYVSLSNSIKNNQIDINNYDKDNLSLDAEFKNLDEKKRQILKEIRYLEFQNSDNSEENQLHAFYDEIIKLESEKEKFSEISNKFKEEANQLSAVIETSIEKYVLDFSKHFSFFAESFLRTPCELTYDNLEGGNIKKFYPKINNKVRIFEEELSESQRFFIDHSFRMSLLTIFYTVPSFYIVETPDSSLDSSYEKNAAEVFLKFLQNPYSLIITTNLNNSSFVNYLIDNDSHIDISIIPLFEIAKKSEIQRNSSYLHELYNNIKR